MTGIEVQILDKLMTETKVQEDARQRLRLQEIADQLVVSIKTVQSHRANVMEKLDLQDITHLVRFAIRHKLIAEDT